MIEAHDLAVEYQRKRRKTVGLKPISFYIDKGEKIAIVGKSGCGKSTLLSVMGCLMNPTSGEYVFEGKSLRDFSSDELTAFRGQKVGFVFQNFVLLSHLTLLENVLLPVQHLGIARQQARERAEQLLEQVGLRDLKHRFPKEVSGGQAQRTAIARALIREPSIILADEPTGSLDSENAVSVLRLLNSLADSGTTVVIATHDLNIAKELDRTIVIHPAPVTHQASLN